MGNINFDFNFWTLTLLLFAAIQILAQGGCQSLFAINRIGHMSHPYRIMINAFS